MVRLWQTGGAVLALALVTSSMAQTGGMQAPGAQQPSSSTMQPPAARQNGKVPAADRKFMHKAAEGGMMEVELGRVAQQKAMNDQVKQFGSRMEQDHSKANNELKQIAANKGVELPAAPARKEQQEIDKLKNMSGAEFDRAYMRHMVSDHKKDVSAFEKQAKNGKDADVKMFAEKTLPTLREHLQMAQRTQDMVKKDTVRK